MADVENGDEIPNLSGLVILRSVKPVFNGQYSSVFHGQLGDQLVCHLLLRR
jgi:hypothetical protein